MKGSSLKVFAISGLTLVFLLISKSSSFTDDKTVQLQVFSTTNVNGYLKPCG